MVSDIDRRKGLSATAAAEVFWGLTPIYWKAVAAVSTHELLALRVLWAIPFAVVLLTLRDAWGDVWRAVSSWHTLSALLLTAALIGCNWFAFLIAMENGQILQSSLGYFITPLVSILLGFVFLGERLHAVQWVAVALAAAGVANQILAVGELPWIALVLAGSFSLYGLLRKTLAVSALPGLFVEASVLAPVALVYMAWVISRTMSTFVLADGGTQGLVPVAGRGKPLSDKRLSKLIKELGIAAVPHGFRSSFRDWAAEHTNTPREVVEAALAHAVRNPTEAAYARSDLFARRRRYYRSLRPRVLATRNRGADRVRRAVRRLKVRNGRGWERFDVGVLVRLVRLDQTQRG